jgi:hypothetical protein
VSPAQLTLPAAENPARQGRRERSLLSRRATEDGGARWFAGEQQTSGDPESPVERSLGGRPTLESTLSRVWEGLHTHEAAECPVCRGRMASAPGGGHCVDCGSRLT